MSMSLPTALALLALAVSVFCLLAVGALYTRLKHVERTAADLAFGGAATAVPQAVRPGPGQHAALLLALDGECPICHKLGAAVAAAAADGHLAGLRVVRVFGNQASARQHETLPQLEDCVDPDVWAEVYDGYTPAVSMVDAAGRVTYRRFVYQDTDLADLVQEIRSRARAAETDGSR